MTVTYGVYFFLGVSVLSLFVAFFFARQVIGSGMELRRCGRSPRPSRKALQAFLKRQYKTVAALLGMGLLLPTFADAQGTRGRRRSQPDAAGFDDRDFRTSSA